ncbi:MAG: glycosyltransferase family 2 protein [Deltaproteobacteria bacterium]|nr:glycosyltransferase family 2 protein [Deltaproteobacteria bacterium]MBI3293205.1 glycosyltransferase family 2 protein [Deltaproteobacteria bacterium]
MENGHYLIPRELPELLSFVFPVFNEEAVLPILKRRMGELQGSLPCPMEMVFVNDGSRDGSTKFLIEWARTAPHVKVVHFSRNFGHQAATTAGLDYATGDAVVVLDADLQDPPELVIKMLELYTHGFDIIYAQRSTRAGESAWKRITAGAFYWIMRKFIHPDLPPDVGDFRLMSRDVVNAFRTVREGHRFIRGLVTWLGFNQTAIRFERPPRPAGYTKFSNAKMFRFALDAILSFSRTPLRVSAYVGLMVCLFGACIGGYTLALKLLHRDVVPGWPSILIIECLLGGSILISLGLLGEYVGRIYEEIKQRPLYIVSWGMNLKPEAGAVRRPALLDHRGKLVRDFEMHERDYQGEEGHHDHNY